MKKTALPTRTVLHSKVRPARSAPGGGHNRPGLVALRRPIVKFARAPKPPAAKAPKPGSKKQQFTVTPELPTGGMGGTAQQFQVTDSAGVMRIVWQAGALVARAYGKSWGPVGTWHCASRCRYSRKRPCQHIAAVLADRGVVTR